MTSMKKALEQTRIALTNALNDPQISATLASFGYGAERLQEGLALNEAASQSLQIQSDARLNKVTVNDNFQQLWQEAQRQFSYDLRGARLLLKQNPGASQFLQLNGPQSRTFDSWHGQAKSFYLGLRNRPDYQAVVQRMGLTLERINQGIYLLEQLEAIRLQQHVQKGNAGNKRNQRDETFAALDRWMFTFRGIARTAFADNPTHLETLGLAPAARKAKKPTAGLTVMQPAFNPQTLLMAAQA